MDKEFLQVKIIKTLDNFSSEWDSIEEFRQFAQPLIHLKEALLDGWYCVNKNESWFAYYQEHGCKLWHIYRFNDEVRALAFAISCSHNLKLNIKEDERLSSNEYKEGS